MGFNRVRFNNFKNIEPREIHWSPGLNLLTGKNGAGKTNILEGISIISGWGPFDSGPKRGKLANWDSGSDEVQLTGELSTSEIIRVKASRRFFMKADDKTVSASDLRWLVPVLAFLPDDMSVIEGSSAFRRRLIDMLLAIIIPSYALRLAEYRRGIKQKALFLKRGLPSMIADRALLPLAAWIWKMREEGVRLLSECLSSVSDLTPAQISLSLIRGGAGICANPEDDYAASVHASRDRESALRFPVVGPHRDDIAITADGRAASESLSRGLRRRTAIALMMASSDAVRRKTGRSPVLLLDEVAAELDDDGRALIFNALLLRKTQAFAATAEPFKSDFPGSVFFVENGSVRETDTEKA